LNYGRLREKPGEKGHGITHNSISEILELLLGVKFLMGKDACDHVSETDLAREIKEEILVRSFTRYWIASFTLIKLSTPDPSSRESKTLVRMARMIS
jgi:hypothetical protein